MPEVGQNVTVFAQFQKAGLNTAPSPAPTVNVFPPGGPASTGNSATVVDAVNFPGWYSYAISNVLLGSYAINFHTSDTTTDKQDMGAAFIVDVAFSASIAAIVAKTNAMSTAVTLTSPTVTISTIAIRRTDDYKNADGRALFSTMTFGNAPVLTGGSIKLYIDNQVGSPFTGVVTGAQTCYVELTHTQCAALQVFSGGNFELIATLANGDVVTIATGTVTVT